MTKPPTAALVRWTVRTGALLPFPRQAEPALDPVRPSPFQFDRWGWDCIQPKGCGIT